MHMKKKFRRYITNIISFANSRTRNSLRDRSGEFYENEVTPDLTELMRRVWRPIVGPDYEVHVIRVQRPRKLSNLGIGLEGLACVMEPVLNQSISADSELPLNPVTPGSDAVKHNDTNDSSQETRHFIRFIVPDSVIGRLGLLQCGDELLQVNGRRLRGSTHTSTLRYLRSLPSHIELVIGRPKHEAAHPHALLTAYHNQRATGIDQLDFPTIEIQASEVGSVDTALSENLNNTTNHLNSSVPSLLVSSTPLVPYTNERVSEWIKKSHGDVHLTEPDLVDSLDSPNFVQSRSVDPVIEQEKTATVTSKIDSIPSATHSQNSLRMKKPLREKSTRSKYSDYVESKSLGRASSLKVQNNLGHLNNPDRNYEIGFKSQTLPRHFYRHAFNRIDPRYGSKRPRWSSVPLLIQLRKSSSGFGFSISEYEELAVSTIEDKPTQKSFTLGRRKSKNEPRTRSVDRLHRSATLPSSARNNSSEIKKQRDLTSVSTSRLHGKEKNSRSGGILLIDSLVPGGPAQLDGRISIGDRLLFINDRNLIKSTLNEAAHALRSAPKGPCLIGIAKMLLEPNENEQKVPANLNETNPFYMGLGGSMGFDLLQSESCNLFSSDDPQLDYQSFPLFSPNPELHSHHLRVPPIDTKFEESVHLERAEIPIGIKLDALAAHGQDGCRILQILDGGAIARDRILQTNDYITSLNGKSMRGLNNLQTFQLLHELSKNATSIDIKYFPATLVENQRMLFLSKLMNPSSVDVNESMDRIITSPNFDPNFWSSYQEITIPHPVPDSDLGLVFGDLDTYSTRLGFPFPSYYLPKSIQYPTFIVEVLSYSPAINLLNMGFLILKVHTQDVSNVGPIILQKLINTLWTNSSEKLTLTGCYFLAHKHVDSVPAVNHESPAIQSKTSLVTGISPNSSDMEQPEPLTEPSILSRPVVPLEPHDSDAVEKTTFPRFNDNGMDNLDLSGLKCPILNDEDLNTDRSSLINGYVQKKNLDSTPPPVPIKRFSSRNSEIIGEHLKVINDESDDPILRYTRPDLPEDQILVVHLPLPAFICDNQEPTTFTKIENMGIRLVGSRCPNLIASYIAGFRQGSVTSRNSGLRIGDEIVQVDDIQVSGMGHLTVQQCILNAIQSKANAFVTANYAENADVTDASKVMNGQPRRPHIKLIVRRNPINFERMASPNIAEPPYLNMTKSLSLGKPSIDSMNDTLPKDKNAEQSLITSPIPDGCKPVTPAMLDQIKTHFAESLKDQTQLFNVDLERGPNGFGIFIANLGPNNEPGVFVTDIPSNGSAAHQGLLKPMDQILAINGQLEHEYETTLELMQQCKSAVCLTIGRKLHHSSAGPKKSNLTSPKFVQPIIPGIQTTVTLMKEDGGLGFSIVGGSDTILGNILIHEIHEDGAAARDGRLQPGDRLLAVNDIDLRDAVHNDATKLIRSAGNSIKLLVYRDPEPQDIGQGNYDCIRVLMKRESGHNLGFSLIDRPNYSTGTAVGDVMPNSVAWRTNLLKTGDVVLEVNGRDVRLAKSEEVATLLKNSQGDVRLLIGRYKTPSSIQPRCKRFSVYTVVLAKQIINTNESVASNTSMQPPSLMQQEYGAHAKFFFTFGLQLTQTITPMGLPSVPLLMNSYIIVQNIEPGSPADRSGMILRGDCLLSIDREPVDWLTSNEITRILTDLPHCTLEFGRFVYPALMADSLFTSTIPNPELPTFGESPYPFDAGYPLTYEGGNMPFIEPPKHLRPISAVLEDDEDLLENSETPMTLENQPQLQQKLMNCGFQLDEMDNHGTDDNVDSKPPTNLHTAGTNTTSAFHIRQVTLPARSMVECNQNLGITLTLGPGISGPIITAITPGSPASNIDLHVGDRILGLNDKLLLAIMSAKTSVEEILRTIESTWIMHDSVSPCSLTIISNYPEKQLKDTKTSDSNGASIPVEKEVNTQLPEYDGNRAAGLNIVNTEDTPKNEVVPDYDFNPESLSANDAVPNCENNLKPGLFLASYDLNALKPEEPNNISPNVNELPADNVSDSKAAAMSANDAIPDPITNLKSVESPPKNISNLNSGGMTAYHVIPDPVNEGLLANELPVNDVSDLNSEEFPTNNLNPDSMNDLRSEDVPENGTVCDSVDDSKSEEPRANDDSVNDTKFTKPQANDFPHSSVNVLRTEDMPVKDAVSGSVNNCEPVESRVNDALLDSVNDNKSAEPLANDNDLSNDVMSELLRTNDTPDLKTEEMPTNDCVSDYVDNTDRHSIFDASSGTFGSEHIIIGDSKTYDSYSIQ